MSLFVKDFSDLLGRTTYEQPQTSSGGSRCTEGQRLVTEPPGRPGRGVRRNPEAKGRCGAISGQWAYWPVSGNRNFHDRLGKLGPRPGVKIAPRLPRVFSPFAGAWGGRRSSPGIRNLVCGSGTGSPVGTRPSRATVFL